MFFEKHVAVFEKAFPCFFRLQATAFFTYKKPTPALVERPGFFALFNETVSRLPLCKDLLTLDLKYYEKNSMQI